MLKTLIKQGLILDKSSLLQVPGKLFHPGRGDVLARPHLDTPGWEQLCDERGFTDTALGLLRETCRTQQQNSLIILLPSHSWVAFRAAVHPHLHLEMLMH